MLNEFKFLNSDELYSKTQKELTEMVSESLPKILENQWTMGEMPESWNGKIISLAQKEEKW